MLCCFFFFSSRRRHTRYIGDWSSDVCSSDLANAHRRGGDARSRALDSVRVVHQPEEELRLATRFQPEKRGEIGQIGRASCRERVEIAGGGGSLEKKEYRRRRR